MATSSSNEADIKMSNTETNFQHQSSTTDISAQWSDSVPISIDLGNEQYVIKNNSLFPNLWHFIGHNFIQLCNHFFNTTDPDYMSTIHFLDTWRIQNNSTLSLQDLFNLDSSTLSPVQMQWLQTIKKEYGKIKKPYLFTKNSVNLLKLVKVFDQSCAEHKVDQKKCIPELSLHKQKWKDNSFEHPVNLLVKDMSLFLKSIEPAQIKVLVTKVKAGMELFNETMQYILGIFVYHELYCLESLVQAMPMHHNIKNFIRQNM